jgi:mono/diheme cytochrome c family protein
MNLPVFSRQVFACAMIGISASVAATVNYENGKQIDQQKCYACHAKKTGFGNGDMIYTRSDSKVNSIAKLKTMVERCNTELRLDLFPEDEADVAAYLNKQFYKFKQ